MGFAASNRGGRRPLAPTTPLACPPEDLRPHPAIAALGPIRLEPITVRVLPTGEMDRRNAALYLGAHWETLLAWSKTGEGPPFTKRGGRLFYRKQHLDAWLDGRS